MKKLLSLMLAVAMIFALAACGPAEVVEDPSEEAGLIKVGIINNDPNESGYRTANDADMKRVFTEETATKHLLHIP